MAELSLTDQQPDVLTRREAALRLGISVDTLRAWERSGIGPRVVRVSPRLARYYAADLADFIARRARGGR